MPLYPPAGTTLSDATPANVQPGVPDAGVATEASRDDHAHDASWSGVAPSASAPGDAAATGAAQGFNRRDHVHGRESYATIAANLKLDDLAAPDDNTDLNVLTTKHGLAPKLSNVSTEYLSGTGVYSVPAGGSGGSAQLASIVAASAAIAATETVVVSASLAAGYLTDGMSFRIRAAGVGTTGATPGSDIFRIRIGPTTLTGTISTSVTALGVALVTAQPFDFEALVTIRTDGAGGTIIGECVVQADNVASGRYAVLNSLSTTVATVAVDTTVTNLLELTYISGNAGSSNTFHVAVIEVLSSGAAGGGSLTSYDAVLGADVTMTTAGTFYAGPSASLAAGTWLINYKALFLIVGATSNKQYYCKLWVVSGTVYDESDNDMMSAVAGYGVEVTGTAIVVLGSTTTVTLSATSMSNGQIMQRDVTTIIGSSANSHTATRMTCVKIA